MPLSQGSLNKPLLYQLIGFVNTETDPIIDCQVKGCMEEEFWKITITERSQ